LYSLWIPSTVDNTSTCAEEPAIAHVPSTLTDTDHLVSHRSFSMLHIAPKRDYVPVTCSHVLVAVIGEASEIRHNIRRTTTCT